MTQHELAAAAGLGRSFISQIESGHFSVTLETVGALSAALRICPTLLIGQSVDASDPQTVTWQVREIC
jgi:transcriptional regulator with XRE-family HTH domain